MTKTIQTGAIFIVHRNTKTSQKPVESLAKALDKYFGAGCETYPLALIAEEEQMRELHIDG